MAFFLNLKLSLKNLEPEPYQPYPLNDIPVQSLHRLPDENLKGFEDDDVISRDDLQTINQSQFPSIHDVSRFPRQDLLFINYCPHS